MAVSQGQAPASTITSVLDAFGGVISPKGPRWASSHAGDGFSHGHLCPLGTDGCDCCHPCRVPRLSRRSGRPTRRDTLPIVTVSRATSSSDDDGAACTCGASIITGTSMGT